MSFAADDTESIARRLKEIEAEKQLALTGSSAPVDEKTAEKSDPYDYGYGMSAYWSNGVNVTLGGAPVG